MGFFALIPGKIWAYLAAVLAVSGLVWAGYHAIDGRGYSRCEREHAVALSHAQEEAHQTYLAEVARGDQLSADLAKTQRRLDAKQAEYLRYAYGITGNCPASLGLLTQAASGGDKLPEAPGKPADPPAADGAADIAARLIGVNIATNYARFKECVARYDALLDWHEATLK